MFFISLETCAWEKVIKTSAIPMSTGREQVLEFWLTKLSNLSRKITFRFAKTKTRAKNAILRKCWSLRTWLAAIVLTSVWWHVLEIFRWKINFQSRSPAFLFHWSLYSPARWWKLQQWTLWRCEVLSNFMEKPTIQKLCSTSWIWRCLLGPCECCDASRWISIC